MQESHNQQRPLEVELVLPVKTYDIDFAGIVSNIVYIRWLEDLRLEIIDAYLPLQKMLEDGIAPILLQTQIEYKQPITIFDVPIGRMWMSKMKKLKWTVTAEIVAGKVATIAEQSGGFINLSSRKPVLIPQQLYQAYLAQQ